MPAATEFQPVYLTGTTTPSPIPDPANTSVYGDVSSMTMPTSRAPPASASMPSTMASAMSGLARTGSDDHRDRCGHHDPGDNPSQYGISAFNYGSGDTTVTTAFGSSITSGSTGLNVGNQASNTSAGAPSNVTVVALGSIHSGTNSNNSGGAPSGIQAGFNPDNAGVFQNDVFGDVSIYVSGSIIADAGAASTATITVSAISPLRSDSVRALRRMASPRIGKSGLWCRGIQLWSRRTSPSRCPAAMSSRPRARVSTSPTSQRRLTPTQDALVTVSGAGTIHSGTINNNSGSAPSGLPRASSAARAA